jgi:hypothetical protein
MVGTVNLPISRYVEHLLCVQAVCESFLHFYPYKVFLV